MRLIVFGCGVLHDSLTSYCFGTLLAGTFYDISAPWGEGGTSLSMKEKKSGTPWTPEEDTLLRNAVAIYSDTDNWKAVAGQVPGRTNKACRKVIQAIFRLYCIQTILQRWLHSLSPNVKKTAWTKDEDQLLLKLYKANGPKWSSIARKITGRTDDACSKRYREALDPRLKKGEWTDEEDALMYEVLDRHGPGSWKEVGNKLNRSSLGCRNRYEPTNPGCWDEH